ncbi:MAG TPA: family 78 glycoside hydrolase catalytic domain [Acidobacteriaceae bacterium]|nr:family 78 glycoside hydrolase catalytic domain [Acidobacteriaceae bacterium]
MAEISPVADRKGSLGPPAWLTSDHQENPLAVDSSQPLLEWMLKASHASARDVRQSGWRVLVSSSPAALERGKGDLWDSGRNSSDRSIDIPYAGKALLPEQRVYWKVEVWDERGIASGWSTAASFTMAPAHWTAQWIAAAPAAGVEGRNEGVTAPMPVFRGVFTLRKPVARALLYVSGMGQDEVHLNGEKVGDRELAPGWTDYRTRILYDTYDVKPMLRSGQNVIGVLLGNGMFNVARTPGRYTKLVGSFGQPQCIAELHVVFRDGSRAVIGTDSNWETAPGPITFSSTYGGEDYDARSVPAGWDFPGRFDAATWRAVTVVPGPGGKLQPESTAPIRVVHVYRPVARKKLASGAVVFDLGQNFAGWPEMVVRGAAGARIRLTSGELLNPDGTVSQASANAGPGRAQWYSYTLSGRGLERWHPLFSYYGFRYVQADIIGRAHIVSLVGDAVHSSAAPTGDFTSSIPLLNQIHTLILHAIENNMESVLTDCPHREKLGWLEQSHLMGSAMNFDFNLQRLYQKIGNDMEDAQKPDGAVPSIAPQYTVFGKPDSPFNDSPEWGSATVLDPWIAYQRYGDRYALRAQYPMMRRYVDYLTSRSSNGILDYGLGDWYDIGPGRPGYAQLTSVALTATAVYYQDILALAQVARVLGDSHETAQLQPLRATVAAAFQQRFYHPDRQLYDRDSQTANAMPLVLGLAPPQDRDAVLQHLIADIRAHNNHVTAGDVGYHYVVDALMENGASDVLLDMLLRTDTPSYGYQLRQGATSLTEAWDASPHSSQDHLMLGHAEEWFYAGLGGIHIDFSRPPDGRLVIDPAMLARIASVDVSYRSRVGTIRVAWKHASQETMLALIIPPDVTATVVFPPSEPGSIREGNGPAFRARGVTFLRQDGASPVFRVASGHYLFSIPVRQNDSH